MKNIEDKLTIKNLDHLGLIAGFIDELGLVEEIDRLIPSERKVSIGVMIKALIINSMGFSQHALYITPSFFEQCPVGHLLGSQYVASDFNDDSIGRCLDGLFSYGLNKLFVQLSHHSCKISGLIELFYHVDTTNFSVEGCYEDEGTAEWVKWIGEIENFTCTINSEALQQIVERKSRFILATNVLYTERLPDESVLEVYKSQASSIESGFGFLKDPIFFTESFFVKKTSRVEGLLMIMTLSLLVYSLCERKLRAVLEEANETVNNQIDKPTQKPTMRMIFNLFRGIHLVVNLEKEFLQCFV